LRASHLATPTSLRWCENSVSTVSGSLGSALAPACPMPSAMPATGTLTFQHPPDPALPLSVRRALRSPPATSRGSWRQPISRLGKSLCTLHWQTPAQTTAGRISAGRAAISESSAPTSTRPDMASRVFGKWWHRAPISSRSKIACTAPVRHLTPTCDPPSIRPQLTQPLPRHRSKADCQPIATWLPHGPPHRQTGLRVKAPPTLGDHPQLAHPSDPVRSLGISARRPR